MKQTNFLFLLGPFLAISALPAETVIYEQSFTTSEATDLLDGTSPTIGAENWVAGPSFQADGDYLEAAPGNAGASATLAFTPAEGLVYTLDASFRNLTPSETVGVPIENDWVAVGFARGQTTGVGSGHRFINGMLFGKAWMLYRAVDTADANNAAWLGTTTSGAPTGSAFNWSDESLAGTYGGGIDMRVVLDTTAEPWSATWYAKLPASETFTEVRPLTPLIDQEINSVGIAVSNAGFSGEFTYFRLASNENQTTQPEITTVNFDDEGNVILTLKGSVEGLTAQRSDDLRDFTDVAAVPDLDGNTLTIPAGSLDPEAQGKEFFRVRN